MSGFVYFAERDGLVKIGFSTTPKIRISALKSKLIGCMAGDKKVEKSLHRLFSHAWVHGEWFRPTLSLTEFINAHVEPMELPGRINEVLTVRVPPHLKRQLKRLASEDQRTLSNLVEVLLSQALQSRQSKEQVTA